MVIFLRDLDSELVDGKVWTAICRDAHCIHQIVTQLTMTDHRPFTTEVSRHVESKLVWFSVCKRKGNSDDYTYTDEGMGNLNTPKVINRNEYQYTVYRLYTQVFYNDDRGNKVQVLESDTRRVKTLP